MSPGQPRPARVRDQTLTAGRPGPRNRRPWLAALAVLAVAMNMLGLAALAGTSTIALSQPSNSARPDFYRLFVEPISQEIELPGGALTTLGLHLSVDGPPGSAGTVVVRILDRAKNLVLETSLRLTAPTEPGLVLMDFPLTASAPPNSAELLILPVNEGGAHLGLGMTLGNRYPFSEPRVRSQGAGESTHHDIAFRLGQTVAGSRLMARALADGGAGLLLAVLLSGGAIFSLYNSSALRHAYIARNRLARRFTALAAASLWIAAVLIGAALWYSQMQPPVAFALVRPDPRWVLNPGAALVLVTALALAAPLITTLTGRPAGPERLDAGEQQGGRGTLRLSGGALLAVAIPVAVFGFTGWQRRWVAEDAFIHFRVAANVLAGQGPVFNLGERVEASTSPLWVALLALIKLLLPPAPLEWIAVGTGAGAALAGLVFIQLGALALARPLASRRGVSPGLAFPIGAVVLVALPPFWDFATSGLETGLQFAWIGVSFFALAVRNERRGRAPAGAREAGFALHRPAWIAVLIGLGPLIRPDLALFSLAFAVALWATSTGRGWRPAAMALLVAAVLPVAYQVFRMGYYGTAVPNTALAKEALEAVWGRGWGYLLDFVRPYRLWLPLGVIGLGVAVPLGLALWRNGDRGALVVAGAPAVAGLVYAAWVVRVGGDFMHARFLLPVVFGLMAPVAAIFPAAYSTVIRRGWARLAPMVAVLPWAVICALWLRGEVTVQGVADERALNVGRSSGYLNPVVATDYRDWVWSRDGRSLRALADQGQGALILEQRLGDPGAWLAPAAELRARVVSVQAAVGLLGVAAGPHVRVVDSLGLADPIAGRLVRARLSGPGHEKRLADEWVAARFAEFGSASRSPLINQNQFLSARRALECGELAELIAATSEPLTVERFMKNLRAAIGLSRLRIPADPVAAETKFCG